MTHAARQADLAPLSAMNTTPLIDVLLVLLVMMIITIPVATNSTDFDLPNGTTTARVDATRNRITIASDGTIQWNGASVSQRELAGLLRETTLLPVEPALQFEPEGSASYDLAAKVLATVKASGVTNFGFVGNDRYAQFEL